MGKDKESPTWERIRKVSEMQNIEMQIAVKQMRDWIPDCKPLKERLEIAFAYIQEHKRDVMWMTGNASEDDMFRVAVAAVMVKCNEEERGIIDRSLKPLQMLSAMCAGIPVDWSSLPSDGDLLPLQRMWVESSTPPMFSTIPIDMLGNDTPTTMSALYTVQEQTTPPAGAGKERSEG